MKRWVATARQRPRGTPPAPFTTARPNSAVLVSIGDKGVQRGSARAGSESVDETRRKPRAIRLLGRKTWNPPGTRTRRDRTRRHPRRAQRCLHPGARPCRRPPGPPRRHTNLRFVGREIKGESFLDLWDPPSRDVVEGLVSILSDECTGTVAGVSAQNDDSERSTLSFYCCRSASSGRALRERLAFWPRSRFRPGWAQARSAH